MSAKSVKTTDHNEIKNWVEERKGKPARVKGAGNTKTGGLLRINFPGGAEDSLENISWDEFFETFDKKKLTFLYQEEKADGEPSTFNKLIDSE